MLCIGSRKRGASLKHSLQDRTPVWAHVQDLRQLTAPVSKLSDRAVLIACSKLHVYVLPTAGSELVGCVCAAFKQREMERLKVQETLHDLDQKREELRALLHKEYL